METPLRQGVQQHIQKMYILYVVIKSNKFNINFKVTNNEHIRINSLLYQES